MKATTTKSERETRNLAINFAGKLKGGELIALSGELGSGKTVFTKGIAKRLGIKENITSPTFNIMKVYAVRPGKKTGPKMLCHIDAYRIGATDLKYIGADEYLGNKEVVTVIEWADKIKDFLPRRRINIAFLPGKAITERRIKIDGSIGSFK